MSGQQSITPHLLSLKELLLAAWLIFKARLKTFVLMALTGAALIVGPILGCLGLGFLLGSMAAAFKNIVIEIFLILGIVGALLGMSWFLLAFNTAVAENSLGVKDAYRQSKSKLLSYFWLIFLLSLITMGGWLLCVIPGLIFSVWFFFALFIFIKENLKGMEALLKSKEYVKGRFWAVAWKLMLIWLISLLMSGIPVVGQILALLLIPYSLICHYLIYENLKTLKGDFAFTPNKKTAIGVLAAGIAGFILFPALLLGLMGTALLGSIFMAKKQMDETMVLQTSETALSVSQADLTSGAGNNAEPAAATENSSAQDLQKEMAGMLQGAAKTPPAPKAMEQKAEPPLPIALNAEEKPQEKTKAPASDENLPADSLRAGTKQELEALIKTHLAQKHQGQSMAIANVNSQGNETLGRASIEANYKINGTAFNARLLAVRLTEGWQVVRYLNSDETLDLFTGKIKRSNQ